MQRFLLLPLFAAFAGALLLVEPPPSPAQAGGGADADASEMAPYGMEYQARGEVHEGYAEPNRNDPVKGLLASKEPPEPLKEEPPQQKPEGDNVTFVPGYWSWDDETADFTWNSGFWRTNPPDRTWMPGRWQKSEGGSRWVSGYWAVAGQEKEPEYLPPPPEPKEAGPTEPAPAENHSYVPGNWVYEKRRYVWRVGYWLEFRPGWVWVPACYKWTPCGFIFVPGYWDVPMLERGLLFAPVRFTQRIYLKPGYVYRPTYCVQPDFLCGALFVRRGAPNYYFGNFFEARYKRTFTPWVNFRLSGVATDLNFSYYKVAYRSHPTWERGLSSLYTGRFAGTIPAPPRTLVQQTKLIDGLRGRKASTDLVRGINLTNLQNVSALASVKKVAKLNVTALSSLAGISQATAKTLAVHRQLPIQKLSPQRFQEEKRGLTRFDALTRGRRTVETSLIGKAPANQNAPPLRGRIDVPRNTPPPRVFTPLGGAAGAPPARPKTEPPLPLIKPPRPGPGDKDGGPNGPAVGGKPNKGPGATTPFRPKPIRPGPGPEGKVKPPETKPGRPPEKGPPVKPGTKVRPPETKGRPPETKILPRPTGIPGKPLKTTPPPRPKPTVPTGPPEVKKKPSTLPPIRPSTTFPPGRPRPKLDRPPPRKEPMTTRPVLSTPKTPIRRPPPPTVRRPLPVTPHRIPTTPIRPTTTRPLPSRPTPVVRPTRPAAPLHSTRPTSTPIARPVTRIPSAPPRTITSLPAVRRPVHAPPRVPATMPSSRPPRRLP